MKVVTLERFILLFLTVALFAGCAPTTDFPTDPAPPVLIAAAAGDCLWGSEALVGTSPEVRMIVSPDGGSDDIEYISDVVSLAWERQGWRIETTTSSNTVTVTGRLEGTEYTAQLQTCSDELPGCQVVEKKPAIYVHVWRSG